MKKTQKSNKSIFQKLRNTLLPLRIRSVDIESFKKTRLYRSTSNVIKLILFLGALIPAAIVVYNLIEPGIKVLSPTTKKMILIKAKDSKIGRSGSSDDDSPERAIYLDAYWIDKFEITVEEYIKHCTENNIEFPPDPTFPNMPNYFTDSRWRKYPAVNITWWEAKRYCECQGKRLPTEAEWENVARFWSNDEYLFPFQTRDYVPIGNYPDSSLIAHFSQFKIHTKSKNDRFPFTAPTGFFEPNGNGIYDLDGNVSEWCLDAYSSNYYESLSLKNPCNLDSTAKRAVVRGPSWIEWYSIVTQRNRASKARRSIYIGFRCAKSATNKP